MIDRLNKIRNKSSEEGFTLVELMIVVVIIVILAAIAIPIFSNQQKAAIDAGVKSDVRNIATAITTTLVKDPTAAAIVGDLNNTSIIDYVLVGSERTDSITLSHPATIVKVQGDWNHFTVTGINPNGAEANGGSTPIWDTICCIETPDGAGNYFYDYYDAIVGYEESGGYVFDSSTGKITVG